ncbi:hypothetical protein DFR50_12574 [Roseiarcus fermentans]|uniref:Uncharacterized protein n=1 Tax=Roseiarcus fermentans TaxID=1473586 RepID=A0A366F1P9_9HYPH|nr:hypothetical protein DFR50_12574 [Roseiarcus fermentans]
MRSLRAEDRVAVGLDILPSPFTDIVGSVADRGVVAPAMHGVSRPRPASPDTRP